mmetsp:Transcript_95290/g.218262  ORF Transcript_95290/g.218262 Transcript_95290/m.218262 type:complete len:211 (+) Transcript_95290:374-1006(+)
MGLLQEVFSDAQQLHTVKLLRPVLHDAGLVLQASNLKSLQHRRRAASAAEALVVYHDHLGVLLARCGVFGRRMAHGKLLVRVESHGLLVVLVLQLHTGLHPAALHQHTEDGGQVLHRAAHELRALKHRPEPLANRLDLQVSIGPVPFPLPSHLLHIHADLDSYGLKMVARGGHRCLQLPHCRAHLRGHGYDLAADPPGLLELRLVAGADL